MIQLTRLNGDPIYVNPHLIETIEANPDSVIRLTTERSFMVREAPHVIEAKVIAYRRMVSVAFMQPIVPPWSSWRT